MNPKLYITVERHDGKVRYVARVSQRGEIRFPYPHGLIASTTFWFDPADATAVRREYARLLESFVINDQLQYLDPSELKLPSKLEDVPEPPPLENGIAA